MAQVQGNNNTVHKLKEMVNNADPETRMLMFDAMIDVMQNDIMDCTVLNSDVINENQIFKDYENIRIKVTHKSLVAGEEYDYATYTRSHGFSFYRFDDDLELELVNEYRMGRN